ncbi:MAG TPA: UDP-3-O-(3-hydroxymyristoyl)glucosamine N-acyltransferase, partial [Elusimicrobia bacterium]|nr:UDP-3-O-(3-hydroxymyristoyl)glucosamine N-acyltransferase [Elusimicrobiota bacterium]
MKLTIEELTTITGGRTNGIYEKVITGAAGLDEAGPTDISFIANPKYTDKVESSKAGVVLVTEEFKTKKPAIIVKNPQLAFAKVLGVLAKETTPAYKPQIHASAAVAESAKVAKSAYIGPNVVIDGNAVVSDDCVIVANSFIGRNSQIGRGSIIYPNVSVRENVAIGERAIIHPGVVIGGDGFGFVGTGTHFKIPQIG